MHLIQEHSHKATLEEIVAQIERRLVGAIDDRALAAWAFDAFYAHEVDDRDRDADATADEADDSLLLEALDRLMFIDDDAFRLSTDELEQLATQLRVV